MLLDDDAIAHQFSVLFRAAEALKQTSVAPQRSPPPKSPYAYLDDVGGASTSYASFLPPVTAESPSKPTSPGLPSAPIAAQPRGKAGNAKTPVDAAEGVDTTCVERPLQLSRVIGDGDVSALRHIGRLIETITAQLQASVDAKLVDFYTHLAKKANSGLVLSPRVRSHPQHISTAASAPTASRPVVAPPWPPASIAVTTADARREAEAKAQANPLAETQRPGPTSILYDSTPAFQQGALQLLPAVHTNNSAASSCTETTSSCNSSMRPRAAFILDDLPSPVASVSASTFGETSTNGALANHSQSMNNDSFLEQGSSSSTHNEVSSLLHAHPRNKTSQRSDLRDTHEDALLTPTAPPPAAGATFAASRRSSLHPSRQFGVGRGSSNHSLLSHNAPMARRIEEERAAAAELQSFFCLLLEAATRQTDATAAALYLDDASLHTSTYNNNNNNESPFPRTASSMTVTRANGVSPSTGGNSGGGGGGVGGRAQFLHCVAHVHGHFPHTISCALTNVLTTVAQSGIAVNLNYSETSAILRTNGLNMTSPSAAKSKAGAAASARSAAAASASSANPSLYLNMYNGVVVPLKGLGCLVLANKAKKTSTVNGAVPPRFSVFDEHVAWSSALISEAVLQQYDRELLLRATTWAPPCTVALRPFLHVKATPANVGPSPSSSTAAPGAASAAAGGSSRARGHHTHQHSHNTSVEGRRLESRLGSRKGLPTHHPVSVRSPTTTTAAAAAAVGNAAAVPGALPDPAALLDSFQKDEAASLIFSAQNDLLAKRLTIVRTEDRQVGKALPPELRATSLSSPKAASGASLPATQKIVAAVARSGGGNGAAGSGASAVGASAGATSGSSGQLNDEDLFLAAAQYITNLESLWRKTIADSNTMHAMVDNYNREIQLRGEKIVHLESRVRELNAHVVQLERRVNTSRFFNSTTTMQY